MSQQGTREGSLVDKDFADLIQELHEARWTGILTLTSMGRARRVVVQEGRPVFASSSNPDDRLGELLLRQGRISLQQFVDASKGVRPGRRLGAVLVEQGVMTPKELIAAVVDHTRHIICSAFQWREGHFRLDPGRESEDITLRMNTPDLLVGGIRRIESWSRVARGVGGLDTCYQCQPGYATVAASMQLAPEERELLGGLHEPRSVAAICALSSLPDFEVCRLLWAFRVAGLVRRQDPLPAGAPSALDDDGLEAVLAGGS